MRAYRSDIDGLRAIAVLPVVLYHAGVSGLPGGFVGVDIFFVISGFLITSIIANEISQNSFSLVKFYERRIRRIAPALFPVLAFCIGLAYPLFLITDYQDFSKSLISTLAFSSNILFWDQAGYFDAPSEVKPLLHMWSLAVEEQFYVFFPILMFVVMRYQPRWLTPLLFLGFCASFALSIWGVENQPEGAFYLLHMRAWELLLGSLLALGFFPPIDNKSINNVLSGVGLGLILWSVIIFTKNTEFPGLNAAFPCVGAGLLIYSNSLSLTLIGRLISLRPIIAIGLISYSLYLWHWPLIVFPKYILFYRPMTPGEIFGILVASFVMAGLSWKYIERPFRKTNGVFTGQLLFATFFCVVGVFGSVGLMGYLTHGMPNRLSAQVIQYEHDSLDLFDQEPCFKLTPSRVLKRELCVLGPKDGGVATFLIWGDSHAEMYMPVFKKLAKATDVKGWFGSYAGCPPLLGITRVNSPPSHKCQEFNDAMFEVIRQEKIRNIVLVARWASYPLGFVKGGISNGREPYITDHLSQKGKSPQAESMEVFRRSLARTLKALQKEGCRVWLIEQVPPINFRVPQWLAVSANLGIAIQQIQPTRLSHDKRQLFVRDSFREYANDPDIKVINPSIVLCEGSLCFLERNGRSLYRDGDHLSPFGAMWMVDVFQPMFSDLKNGFLVASSS